MSSRETEETWLEVNWKFDPCERIWAWQGESFHEKIHQPIKSTDSSNLLRRQERACKIILQASVDHSLAWQDKLLEVEADFVLWQLDLGLLPMRTAPTEESTFRALKLSVSHFTQAIWRPYKERSLGVILHHSDLDLEGFYWDMEQIEQLSGWLGDCWDEERKALAIELNEKLEKLSSHFLLANFQAWIKGKVCIQQYILWVLSQYWHYLASSLDEDCPVLVHFDAQEHSLEYQLQLLAQPIWEHIHLIGHKTHPALVALQELSGCLEPVASRSGCTLGVVVPHPKYLSSIAAACIAELMRKFDVAGVHYRLVLESQLTSHWSGLEELVVWSAFTSELGVRILRGFHASMGSIYPIGYASWSSDFSSYERTPDWFHLIVN